MKKVPEYVEMNIDEMKEVKDAWKRNSKTIQRKLKQVECIEETKENRWDLLSLQKNYIYFLDTIKRIMGIYSELINLGEMDELDEDYFVKRIKEVQRIHNDLHKEINSKSIQVLEIKYISGSKQAQRIVNL